MNLIFYDFEVFPFYWCATFISYPDGEINVIEDAEILSDLYEQHRDDIWIGYNNKHYDQWIMKATLCGFRPWQMNSWLIDMGKPGWEFSNLLNQFSIINYDVMDGYRSLKELEGFMGERIKETPLSFTTERELTEKEKTLVKEYNLYDVENTIKVFFEDTSNFEAVTSLVSQYKLPKTYIGKTKAAIVAEILGCKKKTFNDEWEISIIDTLDIKKYAHIVNWFKDPANYKMGQKLNIHVAGVMHTFGLGGAHGAIERYHGKGLYVHVDVQSMYPSIMIRYDMLSRAVTKKDLFKNIYNTRLKLKREGKKKEQAPYKIVLNSMFGVSGAEFSNAYDPRRNHEVCINGQLLLVDLIEHLEPISRIIQSNTDGLIVQIADTDQAWDALDDACYEWEKRTGLNLSFDVIREIYQKDVNNYLFITEDNKIETKGAWVKDLSKLDNDLPILKTALVNYMTKRIPIEETIKNCNEFIMFQKIVKRSSKYEYVWHNGECQNDKTFRVFASTRESDGYIGKQKEHGTTIEKFGNTPEHCFIWNDAVNGVEIPDYLDKQYYIDLAKQRLEEFGNV